MKATFLFLAVLGLVAVLSLGHAAAKDDALRFLHLMQEQGFGDVAIEYLDELKSEPNPPAEIIRLWDLEMSKSKQAAAKIAYNDAAKKQLTDDAKSLMEKFVKAHPDLPEAIEAAAQWASQQAIQAQFNVLRARSITDKAEQSAALEKARKIFSEVRPRFAQARDAAIKLRAAVSARASQRQKQEASLRVGEARLRLAVVDFYTALTQQSNADRAAQFDKVAKDLESIHREFAEAFIGCEAHYWNARILQEQRKFELARDYYEEVQAYDQSDVPDPTSGKQAAASRPQRKKDPGLEDFFFSEVEQQFLNVLHAVDKKEYSKEFAEWRTTHKPARQTCPGYQGLTLDYARNLLSDAKDAKAKEAAKREALRLLAEMVSIPSPYQMDAAKLRQQLNPNAKNEDSFDYLVIDGNRALEKKDYAAAAACYRKALSAATKKTDNDLLSEIRSNYVGCVHEQGRELYQKGKIDEAIGSITSVALQREFVSAPTALPAAVAALYWRFYQFGAAPNNRMTRRRPRRRCWTRPRHWPTRSSRFTIGPPRKRPIQLASCCSAWRCTRAIWPRRMAAQPWPRPPQAKPKAGPPMPSAPMPKPRRLPPTPRPVWPRPIASSRGSTSFPASIPRR